MTTGFVQTTQGLQIDKDTEARLTYTFDWVDWLPTGDPLVRVSQGIQGAKTYVQLRDGQEGKTYVVTAAVTTTDGLIDRRYFRVKVLARSA